MPEVKTKGRFFLPGPTEVDESVLEAQTRPLIGHRGKAMEEIMERLERNLKQVFRTQRPVYISTSSATGMMEAAIRNGVAKKVLCLINGAFSDRFHEIAVACGVAATPLKVELGQYFPPAMVRDALARDDYDSVTVVHSETSTGVLNPIDEIAQVVHEREDRVLLVDSVSGVGGARVEPDAWKIDFLLTGSQKALAVPPGLAFGVAQDTMLKRAGSIPHRGIYFDLLEHEEYIRKNQSPNTPAVSLLYALDDQLERIVAEGIEARWERHLALARRTYEWIDEMRERGVALRVFAAEGYRSPTVTCISMAPGGKVGSQVAREMQERGYTISAGYGSLKDRTVRIGHMGDHTMDELNELLDVLAAVLGA
jgi:aspartate aminotransferase-like enzyme